VQWRLGVDDDLAAVGKAQLQQAAGALMPLLLPGICPGCW
jgi:hypothetical protein